MTTPSQEAINITQEILKKNLFYDEILGIFTWKLKKCGVTAGMVAGTISKDGYVKVWINQKSYMAHRLAWLYVYGEFPNSVIDHINGDRSNNQIVNLRSCSVKQNSQNQKIRKNNTSGFKGVHWDGKKLGWVAQAQDNGKRKSIGLYLSAEDAGAAYNKFTSSAYGDFYKNTMEAK